MKIDAINNRKRIFKVPLSLHKSRPYVVYPINMFNDFKIPLKQIPLSDENIEIAEMWIKQFLYDPPSKRDRTALSILKTYEDEIKKTKKEYKNLYITIPDKAIPIDIIRREPVCEAIFTPESWDKGNTRRVAFMAAVLRCCGWLPENIRDYITKLAGDWNVGSFQHVIDSWIGMLPPSMETIYSKGGGYPSMNFGDVSEHLPPKPGYPHVLVKIDEWTKTRDDTVGKVSEPSVSGEEEKECIKLLEKPDLLRYVKTAMQEKDVDDAVIGEDHSTLTLFLNSVGTLNDYETINTLKGSSSIGKTAVANMVTGLFKTKKVGELSPTALKYGDHDYDILYIQESGDDDFGNKNFRLISSDDGGFEAETTIKDKETGEFIVQRDYIPAKTFVTTSTAIEIHDEFSTRSYLIPPDESQQQTQEIVKFNFGESQRLLDKIMGGTRFGDKYNKIRKAITLLSPYRIIIPYEKYLMDVFSAVDLRARRDSKKLTQLIKCSAFFFQHQRPKAKINEHNILIATVQDLYNVLRVAGPVLESTLTGFDSRTLKAMHKIPEIQRKDGYITSQNLAKHMRIGTDYSSKIHKQLRDSGYIKSDPVLKDELQIKGRTIVHVVNSDDEGVNDNGSNLQSGITPIPDLDWLKFKKTEEEMVSTLMENPQKYKGDYEICDPITGDYIPLHSEPFSIYLSKNRTWIKKEKTGEENGKDAFPHNGNPTGQTEDYEKADINQMAIDSYQGGDEEAKDQLEPLILQRDRAKTPQHGTLEWFVQYAKENGKEEMKKALKEQFRDTSPEKFGNIYRAVIKELER